MSKDSRMTYTVGATAITATSEAAGEQLVALHTDGTLVIATTSSLKVVGVVAQSAAVGEKVVVVKSQEVVYLRSGAAIAPGARVKVDGTDANEVITSLTADDPAAVIGICLDVAAAANAIVRVKLLL